MEDCKYSEQNEISNRPKCTSKGDCQYKLPYGVNTFCKKPAQENHQEKDLSEKLYQN